jgi:hypothetical protein
LAAPALVSLSSTACYEATPLRLSVLTAATALDCARTADRVFFDSAYVRMNNVLGPDLFYTPRVSPPAQMTSTPAVGLGWGIGVWLTDRGPHNGGACGFELEALSPEPIGGLPRLYSSQRGAAFDQTVKEMAQRLTAAFDTAGQRGG